MINKIFTVINILVLVFVVISGFIKGDISNWQISTEELLNHTSTKYVPRITKSLSFPVWDGPTICLTRSQLFDLLLLFIV